MENFTLRQIQNKDSISKLSLGNSAYVPLKTFLKKDALDYHLHEIEKTYVLLEQNNYKMSVRPESL